MLITEDADTTCGPSLGSETHTHRPVFPVMSWLEVRSLESPPGQGVLHALPVGPGSMSSHSVFI